MDDTIGLNIKSQMALIISKCETATEKVEQLTKYKEEVVREIDNVIDSIRSGYTYCEKCKKWYKNRAWEVKVTKEQRKVASILISASFCSPMDEADIVYAMKDVLIRRLECPVGHLTPYKSLDVK